VTTASTLLEKGKLEQLGELVQQVSRAVERRTKELGSLSAPRVC
jgi:hypothetical protein